MIRTVYTAIKTILVALKKKKNRVVDSASGTYLICGNWGSSDEGRDGGLCNHAVGGDAVRRGVEPGGAGWWSGVQRRGWEGGGG